MLVASFLIAILIAVGLPFLAARWTTRRYSIAWGVFWVGFLTYLASQLLRAVFVTALNGLFASGALPQPSQSSHIVYGLLMTGLVAALFQNAGRLVGFLLLKKKADSWGGALTLGAGHGGLESILIGLAALVNLALVLIFSGNPNALPFLGQMGQTLSMQAGTFWSQLWYGPLLGGFERIAGLVAQIVFTVMVWLAVSKRNVLWFALAAAWQTVIESIPELASGLSWGAGQTEAILAFFLLVNLAILYALSQWTRPAKAAPVVPVLQEEQGE